MNPSPLLVQRLARWGCDTYRKGKVPFLSALVWGLLAYTFAFTNKLLNHDEAGQLFDKGARITSGRWGLSIVDHVLPNYSMPWLYGLMTVVMIALAVCMIVRMFRLRSRLIQVLLAGSIMVFPSVIGLFGYMFTSSAYGLSFLLAVGAVWCIRQKRIVFAIPALALMGFSLSIYQSYISVAAGLLVVLLIQDLLAEDTAGNVLKRGIYYVGFLVLSLAGYYLATQLLLMILMTQFSAYASGVSTFSLSILPQRIAAAYGIFLEYFTQGNRGLVVTPLAGILHLLLMLGAIPQLRRLKGPEMALMLVLIALLPLAINCMFLITPADAVHTLVLYGFIALYVLSAVLLDRDWDRTSGLLRRAGLNLAAAALAGIVIVNTYVSNIAYLNLHLRYENSYAFYTALLAQVQQLPEFREGSKLAVIGSYDHPDFYEEQFGMLDPLTGGKGFLPESYSYGEFLEYYIGLPIPIASEAEIAQIQQTEQFQAMATYPYYGSTAVIGEVIVVKLS